MSLKIKIAEDSKKEAIIQKRFDSLEIGSVFVYTTSKDVLRIKCSPSSFIFNFIREKNTGWYYRGASTEEIFSNDVIELDASILLRKEDADKLVIGCFND